MSPGAEFSVLLSRICKRLRLCRLICYLSTVCSCCLLSSCLNGTSRVTVGGVCACILPGIGSAGLGILAVSFTILVPMGTSKTVSTVMYTHVRVLAIRSSCIWTKPARMPKDAWVSLSSKLLVACKSACQQTQPNMGVCIVGCKIKDVPAIFHQVQHTLRSRVRRVTAPRDLGVASTAAYIGMPK